MIFLPDRTALARSGRLPHSLLKGINMVFFVGIPLGAQDIKVKGVVPLLDFLEEKVSVNALIVNAHTFQGACSYTSHERHFFGTSLRDCRLPDDDGFDALDAIIGPAQKRGIKVYSHVLSYDNVSALSSMGGPRNMDENGFEKIPLAALEHLSHVLEIDLFGRKGIKPCLNNPDYREYYFSLVEDQLRSYPIEGINFNIERYGPLENTLLGNFPSSYPKRKPTAATCFCRHCVERARDRGIDLDRARQAYLSLLEFSEGSWSLALKAGDPLALSGFPLGDHTPTAAPPDGYFVEFLRILMKHPEILAWNQLWYDGLHDFQKELYGIVKSVSPDRKMGWHVWHPRAYSPFERAAYDIGEMRRYSDWIKPKMDHNCVGYRYGLQVRKTAQALFADRPLRQAYEAMNAMLGWDEGPLEELPQKGMSVRYLRDETARYRASVRDEIPIYPGIGLDMPSGPAGHPGFHPTEPEDVENALHAIAEAGAGGVVLSRALGEMREKNLLAAGNTIREIVKRRA